MLTHDQLKHFAERGWILLEGVLNREQVEAYKGKLDAARITYRPRQHTAGPPELTYVDRLVVIDPLFRDLLTLPAILEANKQLAGAALTLKTSWGMITKPHPDRHTRAEEFLDPDRQGGWHRGMRPKWGTFPHDTDENLVNCPWLNNFTYLTDVSPGNGGTRVLEGSHRLDGDYESLKGRCPVYTATAPAGSVLLFTETLLHASVPIVSENTRYAMAYTLIPPWFSNFQGSDVPEVLWDAYEDEELRGMFGGWRGSIDLKLMYPQI